MVQVPAQLLAVGLGSAVVLCPYERIGGVSQFDQTPCLFDASLRSLVWQPRRFAVPVFDAFGQLVVAQGVGGNFRGQITLGDQPGIEPRFVDDRQILSPCAQSELLRAGPVHDVGEGVAQLHGELGAAVAFNQKCSRAVNPVTEVHRPQDVLRMIEKILIDRNGRKIATVGVHELQIAGVQPPDRCVGASMLPTP
ncbi:Uncharacterised protein [Mycobacteroides abscessus subsp. massiliense]|nr:Uncharacterised protein [Mycobacteroides abscessus subsp. massiliense]